MKKMDRDVGEGAECGVGTEKSGRGHITGSDEGRGQIFPIIASEFVQHLTLGCAILIFWSFKLRRFTIRDQPYSVKALFLRLGLRRFSIRDQPH
mgnify:CR=1 FL=1